MNTEPSSVVDIYARWLAALTCACMLVAGAPSAFGAEDAADPFTHSQAVPDPELEELRGGFLTSDGLEIRFGLEQIVLVDGTLATRTSLNLSSLSQGNSAVAPQLFDQNKLVQIIQNGDHNHVSADVAQNFSAGLMTVIQNSLDTQTIQNLTVLNVGVSNMSVIPQRALGNAIDLGLTSILR